MRNQASPAFLTAAGLRLLSPCPIRTPRAPRTAHPQAQPARRTQTACARPAPVDRGGTLVLVGLGNPGPRYTNTRHNVGFDAVELFVARNRGTFSVEKKLQADVARVRLGGTVVHVVKPRTFMNLSGASVRAALKWVNAPLAALLVVADDMSLPVGRVRLRARGSAGGHNGLKSVEGAVGGQEYARLKVGVGSPGGAEEWKGHVLGKFSRGERGVLDEILLDAAEVIEFWVEEPSIDRVISRMGTVKGGRR